MSTGRMTIEPMASRADAVGALMPAHRSRKNLTFREGVRGKGAVCAVEAAVALGDMDSTGGTKSGVTG